MYVMKERKPYNITRIPKTIFGKRLCIILEETGLKQYEVAKMIGVSPHLIGAWTNKYMYPCAQTIVKISKAFNVSADWLLGLSDERELRGGQHEFND